MGKKLQVYTQTLISIQWVNHQQKWVLLRLTLGRTVTEVKNIYQETQSVSV